VAVGEVVGSTGIERDGTIERVRGPVEGTRKISRARARKIRRGTKALHGSSHQRVGLNRKP